MIYARVAGFTFLLYIVAGIASLVLASQTQLANVLTLLTSFCALVLGLMLYALTRQVQPIVALLAMMCRVLEAVGLETDTSAIYFAVGSTLFAWLMLRGRLIPAPLAWLGLIASILLVVILPLQLAGLFGGAMSWSSSLTLFVWLPMLVYEVVLALWLLIKGVALPTPNVAPSRADFVA
jgi:hypothetical protein